MVFEPALANFRRPEVDPREQTTTRAQDYDHLWHPARPTVVFVGTVAIGITIYELTEEVEVRWVDGQYVRVTEEQARRRPWRSTEPAIHKRDMPTGRPLASWQKQWREEEADALRGNLAGIAGELERAAVTIAALVEEGERLAAERRKVLEAQRLESERREAERRRVEARRASREDLLSVVDNWTLARHIESFFEDVEQRAETLEGDERARTLARLTCAKELIGDTDGLRRFRKWRLPEER